MKITSTAIQNLVKDGDSGIYYARVRVNGRLIIRSLETKTFTTAKLRLPDKLKAVRETELQGETVSGDLERDVTFATLASLYTSQINQDPKLKAPSRIARVRPLATLRRTWPELYGMQVRRILPSSINSYMATFQLGKWPYLPPRAKSKTVAGNSPSTTNKLITCLRSVFDLAVKAQVISKNPAASLTYKPLRKKLLRLPNKSQFSAMVHHIRTTPGKGRIAADFVEGLAYSGMRLEEAAALPWQDIDHERRMITVHGTKTDSSARTVPMTEAFHSLTLRIKERREATSEKVINPTDKVFEASDASMSLAKACAAVGVKKMTHHDLRHLFATTCIESGVDVPTVAAWLGHADGGVLAMKTYGHVRPAHSTEAALKVKFK